MLMAPVIFTQYLYEVDTDMAAVYKVLPIIGVCSIRGETYIHHHQVENCWVFGYY